LALLNPSAHPKKEKAEDENENEDEDDFGKPL